MSLLREYSLTNHFALIALICKGSSDNSTLFYESLVLAEDQQKQRLKPSVHTHSPRTLHTVALSLSEQEWMDSKWFFITFEYTNVMNTFIFISVSTGHGPSILNFSLCSVPFVFFTLVTHVILRVTLGSCLEQAGCRLIWQKLGATLRVCQYSEWFGS